MLGDINLTNAMQIYTTRRFGLSCIFAFGFNPDSSSRKLGFGLWVGERRYRLCIMPFNL